MQSPTAVENLFLAALARSEGEARAIFLDDACRDDGELRRRVEVLLHAHERAGDFLERPAADLGPTVDACAEGPGARVGPYKLMQKLGEGGMGVVWVAEQQEPVKRRVALKLIKPGMDSKQVLARFEAERQALALMDHTNIAKVLDAGTTESGRPYFVMELVKGVPITKYCDELHLSVRERLGLFVGVCQAIQHAHTKGVLHRDLKPSNVLVAIQDGRPVAKVIDFGVAKALNQRLTDRTLMTEFGAVVGTLEYMSPEQAELSALDVDTRADVYCLGVLLYELLTGTTPVTRQRLKQAAFDEALRIIREEEPPKPSTRLTESKESLASLAALRKTEPRKLGAEVSGELDWIVMRCLEKDRSRRYESASGLARDVDRHLNGEAVEACPPSVGYRLRKFARRYRRALAMVGVLTVMLLWATIVSTMMAVRAMQAERVAQEARVQAEQVQAETIKAKERADEETANAKAFADFIRIHLLEQGGRGAKVDQTLPMKAVLDDAQKHLRKLVGKNPVQEGSVRHSLGMAYLRIGDLAAAREHLERALTLREKSRGPRHGETQATRKEVLEVSRLQEDSERVEALLQIEVTAYETTYGAENVRTCRVRDQLATFYRERGEFDRAAPLYEKSLAIRRREAKPNDNDTAGTIEFLARTYSQMGRHAEARKLFEEQVAMRKAAHGDDHHRTFWARFQQAIGLTYAGEHEQALGVANEVLKGARRNVKDPGRVGMALELVAWCHLQAGNFAEADKGYVEVVARFRKDSKPGDNPLPLAGVLGSRAQALQKLKRFDESEPLLRECLKIRMEKTKDNWLRFATQWRLGAVLLHRKDYAKAEPLLREAYEGLKAREKLIGVPNRFTLREALESLIAVYEATGKEDEAARRRKELEALTAAR